MGTAYIYTHSIVYTIYGEENEQQIKEKFRRPIWMKN